jgi:hypothetical protein
MTIPRLKGSSQELVLFPFYKEGERTGKQSSAWGGGQEDGGGADKEKDGQGKIRKKDK